MTAFQNIYQTPAWVQPTLVPITQFGGVGDGKTDNTGAFIEALTVYNQVCVSQGNFLVNGTIPLGTGQALFGFGPTSQITGSGGFDVVEMIGNNAYIHDLTINGGAIGVTGSNNYILNLQDTYATYGVNLYAGSVHTTLMNYTGTLDDLSGGNYVAFNSAGIIVSPVVPIGRTITASGAITMLRTDGIVNVAKNIPATTIVNLVASPISWLVQTIKDASGTAGTFPLILTPNSGDIDGSATYSIVNNYDSVDIYSDGTNWWSK